jgi:hypothetical protein
MRVRQQFIIYQSPPKRCSSSHIWQKRSRTSQASGGAVCLASHCGRHAKHKRGDPHPDNQRQAGCQMRLHMEERQRAQQYRHRYPGR